MLWCLAASCVLPLTAQNSVGVTGLIHIPTAEMQPAGTLLVGGGDVSRLMIPGDIRSESLHHYYLNFTMFSWIETSLNFTLLKLNGAKHYNNQDRNGSVRVRLWKEWHGLPQVVVGSNSLFCEGGSSWWEAYYVVATRTLHFARTGRLALTAGYYFPWGKYAAYYNRPFGGISYTPPLLPPRYEKLMTVSLLTEYDSHQWNYGARLTLLDRVLFTMALTDGRSRTWQLGYKVYLKP